MLARIRFSPEIRKDEYTYTVICKELKIAASGDTQAEGIVKLRATIRSFCNALDRRGTLGKALRESGLVWNELTVEDGQSEVVMDLEATAL